jgi:putative DNA primase/helicase
MSESATCAYCQLPKPEFKEYDPIEAGAIPSCHDNFSGINHDIAADWINNLHSIIYFAENGQLLVYNNGVYQTCGEIIIKGSLNKVFHGCSKPNGKSILTKNDINEIISRVQVENAQPLNIIDNIGPYLNLENGYINLETLELSEHTPDIPFMNKCPVRYVDGAECQEFMEFLDQSLEKEYHPALEEWFGYNLWSDSRAQKAMLFHGPKRTGKGTTIRVLESMVGSNNCSHVSLQELATNKFKIANLFGKMANTYGDLPKAMVIETGQFKNLTGEDTIEGEQKFKTAFNFYNKAKMTYSANDVPMLKEADDAFYGRWLILPYVNSCYGREDVSLSERLTSPEELSGVLNMALRGLDRLRSNGWHFSHTLSGSEVYERMSNPIVAFLQDGYQASDISRISKTDLARDYGEWAKKNRMPPMSSMIEFNKRMKAQNTIPVEESRYGPFGEQVEGWVGIIKNPT